MQPQLPSSKQISQQELRVKKLEEEAEHLRLKYAQLQKLKKTHLNELEFRVNCMESCVLEARQTEFESNEKHTVLANKLDRLQQDIICTNKERRLMRKQLYDLKVCE